MNRSSKCSQNIELIERLYESVSLQDMKGFERLCAPDIVWKQSAGFPGGGIYHGAAEIRANVFARLESRWEGFHFVPEKYYASESWVLVTGSYRGQSKFGNVAFEAETAHLYHVENEVVTAFQQFTDTHILHLHGS